MIDRETAVRIVEDELVREHQFQAGLGIDSAPVAVLRVAEHELVWKVYVQSVEYLRTRDMRSMLVGHGPYLVDRVDGGLHEIGAVAERTGEWEPDYRARIRGIPVRTAVDDLHDEVRETAGLHGRLQAARMLRGRLRGLSPAQALRYADGLLGGRAPREFVTVALAQLVVPINPLVTARTIHPGGTAT
ncbi:hypothetical protein H9Y04_10980 [Streptomyces sp. TRM66268-LWL]|uniref:Immunity protein 35 domain-containing protein n=1 Tax=Streptomyces polyasparticus TaxID=2767826 RepID=A0ABR7SFF2_9ACTN|nr:YrhB domain-containing protein [Streptomyces polyasparticus]MBC9713093.1 hypothetical protein [Streptomyces polyasparticus]